MKHRTPKFTRRDVRAFVASFLSYLLLAGQMTPLALAAAAPPAPTAPSDISREKAGATAAAPKPAALAPEAAPLAAALTATKTASFPDPDGDGKADPGQTITYEVTVQNTGNSDATNVTLTDTVDPNTTLVGGSAVASPIAVNDTYNVVGNVRIQPTAAQGVSANDNNPNTGNNTGLTVSGPNSGPANGQLTLNADGSFSYNPNPGFTGTDTFTYTTTTAAGDTDTATVTLNVSGVIWFVNAAAAAGGDGRLTSPFNCLVGAGCFDPVAADDPGDNIFLYSGAYTGGLTLLNTQKLIGQAATATLASIAGVTVEAYSDPLPATGGASPVITTTASNTNGVNLAQNNLLRGFNVGNTTGTDVSGTAFGTLTVSEVALGGTGRTLNLTNGVLAATFLSIASTGSASQGLSLQQVSGSLTSTGGTTISGQVTQCILVTQTTANVAFGNTSCAGGTDGVSLQNNSAGTRSFGTLSISGGSAIGFLHANGGGATTAGATTITNPAGVGVSIQNSNAAVSFGSTAVNKGSTAGTGVLLANNGANSTTFAALAVTTSNGRGLDASSGGAVSVTSAAGSSIASTGGAAIVSNGTPLSVAFTSLASTNSTDNGVNVAGGASGSLTSGTTTITNPTGVGLLLTTSPIAFNFGNTAVNGSGGTGVQVGAAGAGVSGGVTFADLDIAPDSGQIAFSGRDNTGTVTTTSGTIATTNATAVQIIGASAAARSPLNMTLTSVSASASGGNPPNGILLTNTNGPGASVGFVVNGDGSNTTLGGNNSGGVISNTAGADGGTAGIGVRLENVDEVTLRRMRLNDHQNFAVRGVTVANFTMEYSTINGVNGNNSSVDDASVAFDELTGAAAVTGTIVQGSIEDNFRVVNTTGTLNRLTFTDVTFGAMDTTTGDNGLFVQGRNSAVVNVTIQNSRFTSARGDIFQLDLANTATGDLVFQNNTVDNQHPAVVVGGGGVTLSGGGSPTSSVTLNYDFIGNTFRGARGSALLVLLQTGAGSASGTISGNSFGVSGVDLSGSREATAVEIRTVGRGAQTVNIDNNQIRQYSNFGVLLQMGDINVAGSTGTIGGLNATVTNNTIEQPSTFAFTKNGIQVNLGTTTGDTYQACVDILNNNAANSGSTDAGAGTDYVLRQRQATTLRLPGYAGANNDNAAVVAYIQARNIGAETVTASNSVPTGGGFVGGANCTLPTSAPGIIESGDAGGSGGLGQAGLGSEDSEDSTPQSGGGNNVTGSAFVSPRPAPATTAPPAGAGATGGGQPQTAPNAESGDSPVPQPPSIVGDTLTFTIGTLPAGKSVTITFQVTVDDPFPSGVTQVSNQGTVTADGGISVLTDDPAVAGTDNPTVTLIQPPPTINVSDASAPEPSGGTNVLAFTVSLSSATSKTVTVDYATADGGATPATGGASCADPGTDYQTTSGTLTFAPGQTVQTVSVTVCSDNAAEGDETLLVNLSNAANGNLGDAQATGTITAANTPGAILISELRTSGPAGPGDDFVEVYNNGDSSVTVATTDGSAGWALVKSGATCSDTPVVVGVIPNGTVIPARGHYLFVGSQYSLANYGGTGAAAGNQTLASDIEDDRNVGLFNTGNVLNLSTAARLDAVGFGANTGNNCDLLREGSNLPAAAGSTLQYSFFRDECGKGGNPGVFGPCPSANGRPVDSNNNGADFIFADTGATAVPGVGQRLGAPGPENLSSPIQRNDTVASSLLDPAQSTNAPTNRGRDLTSDPANNSTFGTISIRRTYTNNTGANVTRLRFRIVDMSVRPAPSGAADLRARTSTDIVVTVNGSPRTVRGTTLETPPAQPMGGGLNSTLSAGTVTLGSPLAPGAAIDVQFLLGVEQQGAFKLLVNIEALP